MLYVNVQSCSEKLAGSGGNRTSSSKLWRSQVSKGPESASCSMALASWARVSNFS